MENSLHIFNALIPLRYYTYDLHSEKRLGICDGIKAVLKTWCQEHHVPVSTMNYWMHKLKFSKRKIIRRIASPYIQLHNKKQEMLVLYSILFERC